MNKSDKNKKVKKEMPETIKLAVARAYFDYKNKKISLDEFEKIVEDNKVEVKFFVPDLGEYKLLSDVQRIQAHGYRPEEVRGCEFFSEEYEKVVVNDGIMTMRFLAKHGDKEAINHLNSIKEWEQRQLMKSADSKSIESWEKSWEKIESEYGMEL